MALTPEQQQRYNYLLRTQGQKKANTFKANAEAKNQAGTAKYQDSYDDMVDSDTGPTFEDVVNSGTGAVTDNGSGVTTIDEGGTEDTATPIVDTGQDNQQDVVDDTVEDQTGVVEENPPLEEGNLAGGDNENDLPTNASYWGDRVQYQNGVPYFDGQPFVGGINNKNTTKVQNFKQNLNKQAEEAWGQGKFTIITASVGGKEYFFVKPASGEKGDPDYDSTTDPDSPDYVSPDDEEDTGDTATDFTELNDWIKQLLGLTEGGALDDFLTGNYNPSDVESDAPEYQTYTPTENQGYDYLKQIIEQATGGSLQNYDRAANRLRDRLTIEAGGQKQALSDTNYRQGFQGQLAENLGAIDRAKLGAYQEGLVGLESEFENARLQGLGLASDAAGNLTNAETALQGEQFQQNQNMNEFNQNQFQFIKNLLEEQAQFGSQMSSQNQQVLLQLINQILLGKGGIGVDIMNMLTNAG